MTSRGRAPVHTDSVTNLYKLLRDAKNKPELFATNADFVAALRSQSALAKYTNKEREISSSSINTLKRIADKEIDGGFATLDAARAHVKMAIEDGIAREGQANKSTKQGLRAKVEDLEIRLLSAHQGMWQLTKALNESIQNSRSYAESSGKPSIVERCRKEQRKLLKVFALFAHPIGERSRDDEA